MLGGSSITPNFSQSQELILMDKNVIQQLEQQVDELLRTSRRLREENMLLRSQQTAWLSERAQLIEKTDVARSRIEKMVSRLKELDSEL
jgi:cell division protein ZapB